MPMSTFVVKNSSIPWKDDLCLPFSVLAAENCMVATLRVVVPSPVLDMWSFDCANDALPEYQLN